MSDVSVDDLDHHCTFPEVVIEEVSEGDEGLAVGMKVLTPCACGETPADYLGAVESHSDDMNRVVLGLEPFRFLFHWAPRARRKQIVRYGLRPNMRPSVHTDGWKASVICLADSPSWAWALSGAQRHAVTGDWDLWQTSLDRLTDPRVLPSFDRPSGMHEVRTEHRIFKRDLWLVATRFVPHDLAEEA